jgi:hypothetical protein
MGRAERQILFGVRRRIYAGAAALSGGSETRMWEYPIEPMDRADMRQNGVRSD